MFTGYNYTLAHRIGALKIIQLPKNKRIFKP